MKMASLVFFALLFYAHRVSDLYGPLEQPLSCFREGELGLLGYGLFCSIFLVGAFYVSTLRRIGQAGEAANAMVAGMFLLIVAATPSAGTLHAICAFVLLTSIYAYYGVLLFRSRSPVLLIHLAVPILLAVATRFQSYGIWQKALISYFVLAAVVHHHVVSRRGRDAGAAEPDVFYKERKVYCIDAGSRHGIAGDRKR